MSRHDNGVGPTPFFATRRNFQKFAGAARISLTSLDELEAEAKQEARLREKRAASAAQDQAVKASAQTGRGQKAPKKRKITILDQWVEIRIAQGAVTTTLYPSNEELLKERADMAEAPDLVYRRLNFPDGVPDIYHWSLPEDAAEAENLKQYGGCGIQRLTVEQWVNVIEREKLREGGHVGPTGVGNLPRPEERGGCDCASCTAAKARLGA